VLDENATSLLPVAEPAILCPGAAVKRFRKTNAVVIVSAEELDRKRTLRYRLLLCVLSGLMLGFSFPPSPFGILACFGLVPLLIVLAEIDRLGTALRYSYLTFFIFHLITLNWTGGYAHGNDTYMMIAGGATMIIHPVFYWIPMTAYFLVKRYVGDRAALVALPAFWVAYEFSHSLSEWSFPWLTIGNSQSYDLARIQFISLTGIYGLSLWIIILNCLAYALYSSLAVRKARGVSRRDVVLLAVLVFLYLVPLGHGLWVLSTHESKGPGSDGDSTVTVGIVQSNVDPWDKWGSGTSEAVGLYRRLTERLVDSAGPEKPDLILWPETAMPFYVLAPRYAPIREEIESFVTRLDVPVLTGLPNAVFYADSLRAPRSAKRALGTGERYDSFNAAALFQPGGDSVAWYGKMKMVPFAERIPYADFLSFIDFLRWDVGIGGWTIGRDSTIFVEKKTGTRFCTMICYESVYPSFVSAFVRKGAEFIAIITIDSWWDKMSGAYQHGQFAIFRAIENRRWVARCAVGGFSCYIDPYGRVYDKTDLFTVALLNRTIGRSSALSPYVELGDWLSELAVVFSGMFLAAALGRKFFTHHRQNQ
jgi:apolipoprotein N-acyltransferase